MYSTHNEETSVVAERFIRTLKNKIYRYMNPISKNVYIEKLDDIVDKYNNKYHKTIKLVPVDVNPSIYLDFNTENNKVLNLKLEIMLISKDKNIFARFHVPNWSEEVSVTKKS